MLEDTTKDQENLREQDHNSIEQSLDNFKLTIDKKTLVKSLYYVQSVVEKRNIIPILSHALLRSNNNSLEVVATDMDIVISSLATAKVIAEGEITVNAAMLYDIVRKLDDNEEILLEFDNIKSLLNIYSGHCYFRLPTLPVRDFPKIDDLDYQHNLTLNSITLKTLFDQCKFAMSTEETRYNLNGINLEYADKRIRLVATDGHRLSVATSHPIDNLPNFLPIIIPKKTVTEIRKIIDELSSDVNINISNNKIKFFSDNFSLTSKLVDATFPKYHSLMPTGNDKILEIPSKEFKTAIDRVATVTNEKFRGVNLIAQDGVLEIAATSDIGSGAKEQIKIKSNLENKFKVGFNARYILEAMNVICSEYIYFSFKDPFAPALITEIEENPESHFQYIIMPMRV